jgi:homogentisate 1,2-dioxygenase
VVLGGRARTGWPARCRRRRRTEPARRDGDRRRGSRRVLVRTRAGFSRLTYLHHPFDVVGWDGYLYPYAFNIADFEPIVNRTHAPPPVHQTFEGPNFVVCSFCPRPLDLHEEAVPLPYNHHPAGSTHGPQPGAVEGCLAAGATFTLETAVMVDTFRPLLLGPAATPGEDPEYAWTWAR